MASTPSTEARELALIEKVELRIALADTDTKLESTLNTYLAPLLLKLSSEHVSVRNKVISICQHVTARTKPLNIRLPVAALLKQYREYSKSPLIRHFDLLFTQQGISRLRTSEFADLLPVLTAGIAQDALTSAMHGATVFHLLLRSLNVFKFPPKGSSEDTNLRATLHVSDSDAKFLAFWFGKILMLRLYSAVPGGGSVCPGLSSDEYTFLTMGNNPEAWDPSKESGLSVTEAKLRVTNLLASGVFKPEERFFPALVASADPNSRISDLGHDLFKRTVPVINLDDVSLVDELYTAYDGLAASDVTKIIPPVHIPLRVKILSILSMTGTSTTFPAKIVSLVQRDLIRDAVVDLVTYNHREANKLRSAVVAFLTFVARRAPQKDLDAIAKPAITALKHFIEHQEEGDRSLEAEVLRGNTYQIIGQLAAAHQNVLFECDLSLLRWLMQSLSEERNKNVVLSIDEAISTTLRRFQEGLDPGMEGMLRSVLLDAMNQESTNARNLRYVAVRFANRCLAYKDVVARWINILALGQVSSESHETMEEAKKGLDPYWYQVFHASDGLGTAASDRSRKDFPKFQELVVYIFGTSDPAAQNVKIQSLAVPYCRQALVYECLKFQEVPVDIGLDWERNLDLAVSQDRDARQAIRKHLHNMFVDVQGQHSIETLWQGALRGMLNENGTARVSCARVLVELCTLGPDMLISRVSSNVAALESALLANDMDLRLAAAQAYGLLSAHPACASAELQASLERLLKRTEAWNGAVGAETNRTHGSALALASFISHRLQRRRGDDLAEKTLSRFLPGLLEILDRATDPMLAQASFMALGQLCSFYAVTPERISAHMPFSDVVLKLARSSKAGNEKAITALGYISMVVDEEDEKSVLDTLLDQVHDLHEIRQTETQFAVGEALNCVASAWGSTALMLDMDGPEPVGPSRTKTLSKILDRVLGDAKTTKPALKKASVIWLLCFIQFCGNHPEVQERLHIFQAAFKRYLSDRDELVQEAASRGLGLVYERGTKELKDNLVKDLVGSFSSDRADLAGTITEDTQLFAEGALPTGEGSVQTYKDIMSLASETGDSSLVYRFMSLASNNAIWSSRAAFGRFGLSTVLSDASVDGFLAENAKLYPKLFRYRFDPNSNVRRSMNDIWNALVKDSTKTIDTHLDLIMEDLLASIVNREWRVRQASCAAIADLVQGKNLNTISKYLDEIWSLTFKVLDDIKESVRGAAAELSRVMIGILIRSLESDEGSTANATTMLKGVFPFLLSTSGIESGAKEVQAISLHTLLQIVKKAKGTVLRPFIPELVESLLGLLTALEPGQINQIHLNAEKYGITEEALDNLRESSIRSGPLMGGIERCLDLLDEDSMKQLAPRLQTAMRSAVGLPSKIGCSRVLVSLSTRRNFIFRPFADDFMSAIQKAMVDRNERVCSSYAVALGHVARVASDDAVLGSAAYAKRLYFESEDTRSRVISGEIVRAIGKYATDRFAALASDFLPLVYIARHDEDALVKKLMQDVWDDNTGGPRAATLYLREIIVLASANLSSKRWILKHAAALAAAEATDAVAATQDQVGGINAELIWPALQKALAEKSWDGKERVLEGFVTFVKRGTTFWEGHLDVREAILKIATREARRRNAGYRQFAIGTLGDVAECVGDTSFATEVVGLLGTLIDEIAPSTHDEDGMQLDGETDDPNGEAIRIRTIGAAVDALFQASCVFVTKRQTPSASSFPRLLEVARQAHAANTSANSPIHRAVFGGCELMLKQLLDAPEYANALLDDAAAGAPGNKLVDGCAALLLNIGGSDDDGMPEVDRVQRSEAILTLARLVVLAHPRCRAHPLQERFANLVSASKSRVVRQNLAQALQMLEKLE